MHSTSLDDHQNEENPEPLNAPIYMTPKHPVLDEPLETGDPAKPQDSTLAESTPENEPRLNSTPDAEDVPDAPGEVGGTLESDHFDPDQKEDPPTDDVVSAYFPRGIYEDARSVEAFYGRDGAQSSDNPQAHEPAESFTSRQKFLRTILMLIACVLILIFIFLSVTGRINFPFS